MLNIEQQEKLAAAINSMGSVSIIQDQAIPGCPHFGDRYTFHVHVEDRAVWEGAHRPTLCRLLAESAKPIQAHICTMYGYDKMTKRYTVVHTMEFKGEGEEIDNIISVLGQVSKTKVPPVFDKSDVKVDSMEGRTDKVTSTLFSPKMMGRGY
jgi:hypothetical protein